jgi:hypothetical protein
LLYKVKVLLFGDESLPKLFLSSNVYCAIKFLSSIVKTPEPPAAYTSFIPVIFTIVPLPPLPPSAFPPLPPPPKTP